MHKKLQLPPDEKWYRWVWKTYRYCEGCDGHGICCYGQTDLDEKGKPYKKQVDDFPCMVCGGTGSVYFSGRVRLLHLALGKLFRRPIRRSNLNDAIWVWAQKRWLKSVDSVTKNK